jgi:dihydrofolate reductase
MKHFKQVTMDHAVVMGRRTFESLGSRPLPGRTNIVVTRDKSFRAEGAFVAHSFDEAMKLAVEHDRQRHHMNEIFVLGGTAMFALALPHADRIVLTLIDAEIEGDAGFPQINEREWTMTSDEPHEADARNPYPWRFQVLERSSPGR